MVGQIAKIKGCRAVALRAGQKNADASLRIMVLMYADYRGKDVDTLTKRLAKPPRMARILFLKMSVIFSMLD